VGVFGGEGACAGQEGGASESAWIVENAFLLDMLKAEAVVDIEI
jgi:hypothetical protein